MLQPFPGIGPSPARLVNLNKLKEAARKYEQREEWRRAIDVYLQAIQEAEEAGEGAQDPGLYNRVGDLELKAGDSPAGMRAYEQAAELYAEQGFFNNAIALCQKILRVNPGRTDTYLRLAQLHARKNFVGEAKKNLIEYIERQNAVGQLETAFAAVKVFADRFSTNPEVRLMLVELLRTTSRLKEAREQLQKLAEELEARGDTTGARRTREQLDAISDEEGGAAGNDLVFIDTGVHFVPPGAGRRRSPSTELAIETSVLGDALDPEPEPASTGEWETSIEPVEGLDAGGAGALPSIDFSPGGDLASLDVDDAAIDLVPGLAGAADDTAPASWIQDDVADAGAPPLEGLDAAPFDDVASLDPPPAPIEGRADTMYLQLEDSVVEGDPSLGIEPGQALLERARKSLDAGDRTAGRETLQEALKVFEAEGRWEEALQVSADIVRLEPDDVAGYQKQVEIAYRTGHRSALIGAYLELAEALVRLDAITHAMHVYRHILDHDPENEAARAAVDLLSTASDTPSAPPSPTPPQAARPAPAARAAPAPPPPVEMPARGESFVDLGALILDEEQPRDTRIRVGQKEIENEDQAFHEALADFKRGIEQNLDAEDFQAHYDLGIAFKEMGLIDEAIAQFQKALRSPEGRLKTSEQLGSAFYEKGQFAICEAVLGRAVDGLPGADDEKIGLLYWLGRALESQQRGREALPLYQRALAVDIRFLDLGERVKRLATGAAS
ncbi:MAG: tetratricopeptide repeat protein [Gemmatimonadales bacterium]